MKCVDLVAKFKKSCSQLENAVQFNGNMRWFLKIRLDDLIYAKEMFSQYRRNELTFIGDRYRKENNNSQQFTRLYIYIYYLTI